MLIYLKSKLFLLYYWAFLVARLVKNPPAKQKNPPGFDPWVGKILCRRERLQYSGLKNSMDSIVSTVNRVNTVIQLPWWLLQFKESVCQCRRLGFHPWVRKILWRRKWQPTPEFLPGKSHGQRNLLGYSPWGYKRVQHNLVTKQQQTIIFYIII